MFDWAVILPDAVIVPVVNVVVLRLEVVNVVKLPEDAVMPGRDAVDT